MGKLHRCPECGAIDFGATLSHMVRYLLSASYRRAIQKARAETAFWRKLTERSRILEGEALNWQEIDLSQLTATKVGGNE